MCEALLIVGHGSRDPEGVAEFLDLCRILAERCGDHLTSYAFLEYARPSIGQAIEQLIEAGARRIVCQPVMLFGAGHVKHDIPCEIGNARRQWPSVAFELGGALGMNDHVIELCRLRWNQELRELAQQSRSDTTLLLVGRGSSDADANERLQAVAERLQRAYHVGGSMACFSSLAEPSLLDALHASARSPCARVVVQPYFLFTGVLVKQIRAMTAEMSRQDAQRQYIVTQHLGAHPLLAAAFERHWQASPPSQQTQSLTCARPNS
jgi:sirohydrochlorin ferrochelatase